MTTQYSIQNMVSDGTLSVVTIGLQYLQRSDIYIRIAGEETPQSGASNGYTWSFISDTTIKILPVVPSGTSVVLYRRTYSDGMHNVYSQSAQFDEATIDENNTQLLFLSQEYLEQGSGIEAVEYLRSEGNVHYYRLQLYGGKYTDEFTITTQLPPGYERGAGDFVTGFTVLPGMRNVAWLNPSPTGDNNLYSWSGYVPSTGKIVPPNSTPQSTGGFIDGWIPRTDEILRADLAAPGGAGLVGGVPIPVTWGGFAGGAVPNGTPADAAATTTAIMAAINGPYKDIFFPDGVYYVNAMLWTTNGKRITFSGGAKLYGVDTTPVDALLTLHNYRNGDVTGLVLESDGVLDAPQYALNYGCALRFTSDSQASPTQFLTIDGLDVRYIKDGVVNGNLLGQSPQPSFPQSEIFIRDYKQRGVMRAFYNNALNSYVTTSGCVFATQKFEAGAWWDDTQAFNLRGDAGVHISIGDEFQAARQQGYNVYGKDMFISNPVWEHSCPNYLTGDITISDMANGYFGNGNASAFVVPVGTSGRALLENVNIRRPTALANSSQALLFDAIGSPNYQVDIVDSKLGGWRWNASGENALLVRGGKLYARNMRIDNTGSTHQSWDTDITSKYVTKFDPTGLSMSTVQDMTQKGGWTPGGSPVGSAFHKYTLDLPPGFSSAIRFVTNGTATSISTPTGVAAECTLSNTDIVFKFMFKMLTPTLSQFNIQVVWYDFMGNSLGPASGIFSGDGARMLSNGFGDWAEIRAVKRAPSGAVRYSLLVTCGSTADIAFIVV